MREIPLFVPPVPEQSAIARFLDYADRRIRRFIQAKHKLIKLLNEQKQVIIHRAVTRGVDPNLRLKPSVVPSLGDVPANWQVVSLRYLATKFGSGITPRGGASVYQETGVPFLRSQNIQFDGLRLLNVAHIPTDLHEGLEGTHVHPGDVLLNITGASIGRVCAVPGDFAEGNVSQHVCIIRPRRERILPGFLAAFLSTPFMQREIRFEQNGASREGLTLASIRAFKILLPGLEEQRTILTAIEERSRETTNAAQTAEREIELLREYRARLTSDVVTGKLDVRKAVSRLSEEVEEPEPIDESEPADEAEKEIEGETVPEESEV
jgi:type I restriction enzyme S subunit